MVKQKQKIIMATHNNSCRVCHKCARSYYREGTSRRQAHDSMNLIMRLHHKRCKGELNLTVGQVNAIIDRECDSYGAPDRGVTVILESFYTTAHGSETLATYSGRGGTSGRIHADLQ